MAKGTDPEATPTGSFLEANLVFFQAFWQINYAYRPPPPLPVLYPVAVAPESACERVPAVFNQQITSA
jgi:hypothetical protein